MITKNHDSYNSFKNDIINHNATLNIQYEEIDNDTEDARYSLSFIDGNYESNYILYHSDIDDKNDFDTNYKDNSNKEIIKKDNEGFIRNSYSFVDTGYNIIREMYKFQAQNNGVTFFDVPITSSIKLSGGEYWIDEDDVGKIDKDDYLEFSVIDKDGVLVNPETNQSLFDIYGLTKGSDILELKKFIRKEYIRKGSSLGGYKSSFLPPSVQGDLIIPGLYLRCSYNSFGLIPITILIRLFYYEK